MLATLGMDARADGRTDGWMDGLMRDALASAIAFSQESSRQFCFNMLLPFYLGESMEVGGAQPWHENSMADRHKLA